MTFSVSDSNSSHFDYIVRLGDKSLKNSTIEQAVKKTEDTVWKSITEALDSLGYNLPESYADSNGWHQKLNDLGVIDDLPANGSLRDAEDLILSYISLDGDYTITKMPKQDEVSLNTHILHYRLKILGLLSENIDSPYAGNNSSWEEIIRSWLFTYTLPKSRLDLVNLLGNISVLWEAFLSSKRNIPVLLIKGIGDPSMTKEDLETVVNSWKPIEAVAPINIDYSHDMEDVYDRDNIYSSAQNMFGIRLLRIALWMNGHCGSFISSGDDFDDAGILLRTLDGLTDIGSVIRALGDCYWAVNITLLKQLFLSNTRNKTVSEVAYKMREIILADTENEDNKSFFRRIGVLTETSEEIKSEKQKNYESNFIIRFFKRAYQGIKRVIQQTVRLIKDGISWIMKRIVKPVTVFISRIIADIMKGWSTFKKIIITSAKEFFSGVFYTPKESTGEFVITKMNFDADMSLIINTSDEKLLEEHGKRLLNYSYNLNLIMSILGKVIHLIITIAAGPIGWAKLAFTVGSMVIDMLNDKEITSFY